MADLVLRDLDPLLNERIRRVAVARGWTREHTCVVLLEQGLFASELEVRSGFHDPEVNALAPPSRPSRTSNPSRSRQVDRP